VACRSPTTRAEWINIAPPLKIWCYARTFRTMGRSRGTCRRTRRRDRRRADRSASGRGRGRAAVNAAEIADRIVRELGGPLIQKSHDGHIGANSFGRWASRIAMLEDDNVVRDAVLTVHHACIQTLTGTRAAKMIENHNGVGVFHVLQGVPAR